MTTISLFTPINYTRSTSFGEKALSKLSHYFYLGGAKATVIKSNEVRLEKGNVSWKMIALKVASYVLLFPITLTLFAIDLVLRTQYHFIVISPSKSIVPEIVFDPSTVKISNESLSPIISKEKTIDTLTKCADREGDAYLIDFSKITPSNIFEIFAKGSPCSRLYGDAAIDDRIFYDESAKFTHNFPFKFSMRVVILEKNDHGYPNSNECMFTMNSEGKVESYGKVFDNFDLYLEYFMKKSLYSFSFEHLDFHSIPDNYQYKKLRKKSSI